MNSIQWVRKLMLNVKIENDIRNEKKQNKLKFSRLVEQISDWEKNNDVSIISIARMRKKRRDDCHLSELSFSRVDTNFSKDLKCSDIWRRNYLSLLKFVKWIENVIETFIFLLIQIWEWNEWLMNRSKWQLSFRLRRRRDIDE